MDKDKSLVLVYQMLNYTLNVYSEILVEYYSILVMNEGKDANMSFK